jgi:aspartate-semialdehyde dehydrogenase
MFTFRTNDIVLSSAGAAVSAQFAPRATEAGAIIIDNTSQFRMDEDIPLVVPEVNPEAIAQYTKRHIIANPNCSTIQMVVALKPLHDVATIKRIVVSTYQSVSGAGAHGMSELDAQHSALACRQTDPLSVETFSRQIAGNAIPQIDVFMGDGSTKEEWKMVVETRKIVGADIKVTATCVRVPVFVGHAEAVNVEFVYPLTACEAERVLRDAPGVCCTCLRERDGFVTPLEAQGYNDVFVSRLRQDSTVPYGLSMWIVADNLRKGAALNAVQIAELLLKKHL